MENQSTEKIYKTPAYTRKCIKEYYEKNRESIIAKNVAKIKNDPVLKEKHKQQQKEYRLRKKLKEEEIKKQIAELEFLEKVKNFLKDSLGDY